MHVNTLQLRGRFATLGCGAQPYTISRRDRGGACRRPSSCHYRDIVRCGATADRPRRAPQEKLGERRFVHRLSISRTLCRSGGTCFVAVRGLTRKGQTRRRLAKWPGKEPTSAVSLPAEPFLKATQLCPHRVKRVKRLPLSIMTSAPAKEFSFPVSHLQIFCNQTVPEWYGSAELAADVPAVRTCTRSKAPVANSKLLRL